MQKPSGNAISTRILPGMGRPACCPRSLFSFLSFAYEQRAALERMIDAKKRFRSQVAFLPFSSCIQLRPCIAVLRDTVALCSRRVRERPQRSRRSNATSTNLPKQANFLQFECTASVVAFPQRMKQIPSKRSRDRHSAVQASCVPRSR